MKRRHVDERALRIEPLEDRCVLATVTVTTALDAANGDTSSIAALMANDGGDGISLREAILAANNTPNTGGPDIIHFAIAGAGVHTIRPTSPLPTITNPVIIDGYSQPGANPNSAAPNQALNTVLRIELSGNLAGSSTSGLSLGPGSGGSTIQGLAINQFAKVGIHIDGAGGNTIAGNFLGTNPAGTAAAGNGENGVFMTSSAGNTIGGVTPAAANLVSGNILDAVVIVGTTSTGNVVQGNRIGVDITGTLDLGNGESGVLSFQGSGTIVGGTTPGAGNLISGNGRHGVWMLGGANDVVIQGNTIGTNLAGTAAIANNGSGISIENSHNAQIGGGVPGAGNLISGGTSYGISLDGTSNDAVIKGNLIGTDRSGTLPLGNGNCGINVPNSSRVAIGGLAAGEGNVIAKSQGAAIAIQNGTGHMILGNKIGTDMTGSLNLGNQGGIDLSSINNSVIKWNVVAYNGSGISVSGNTFGDPEVGILISQNSIHSNLHSIQLDLFDVTSAPLGPNWPQDPADDDTGVNNVQNFPVITSVTNLGSATRVSGTLTSRLNSNYRLEFFASGAPATSGFGPGQTFLGDLDLAIGAGDHTVPFSIDLPALPPGQVYVTATATDITDTGSGPRNDTSEFSAVAVLDTALQVTSTADSGAGSIRAAIAVANFLPGPNTITFNIPASDPGHLYYQDDGLPGQVSASHIASTTLANDGAIVGIDPDWPHSWYSVELASQLFITDQIEIDGYSQPGAVANTNGPGLGLNSVLRVELNGSGVTGILALDGLVHLASTGSVIKGLAINRSMGQIIHIDSGGNNRFEGNYLGTDISGSRVFPLGFNSFPPVQAAISVDGSAPPVAMIGNVVGGTTPAASNLLSGNTAGVALFDTSSLTRVEGNLIGTDRTGTRSLENLVGVYVESVGNVIGGATPSAGNVISGNLTGILLNDFFDNSHDNLIQNNRIGTDPGGTFPVENGVGIDIRSSDNNRIVENVIAFNGVTKSADFAFGGIIVSGMGNLFSRNSLFANHGSGIELGGNGIVRNDVPPESNPPDQDTGPNGLQNYPLITSAIVVPGGIQVGGKLESTPNSSFVIEFFANAQRDAKPYLNYGEGLPFEFGEGKSYLGMVSVTTNSSGAANFSVSLPAPSPGEDYLTATATDVTSTGSGPLNNTSGFSPVWPIGGMSTVVTNTRDDGVGSLREAMIVAGLTPGPDTITFNISPTYPRRFYYQDDGIAGQVSRNKIAVTSQANDAAIVGIDPDWPHSWYSIELATALPTIVDQVDILGYTQPGSSRNTLPAPGGLNTVLKIELDGSEVEGNGIELVLGEPVNLVEGLAIHSFGGSGIYAESSFGNRFWGNFIGTDVSGTIDLGNGDSGIHIIFDSYNRVGGLLPAQRNLISGNAGPGVRLQSSGSDFVQGNLIGVDRTGEKPLVNDLGGVFGSGTLFFAKIGGTELGAANRIATAGNDAVSLGFPGEGAQAVDTYAILQACAPQFAAVLDDRAGFYASNSRDDFDTLLLTTFDLFACVEVDNFDNFIKGNVVLGNSFVAAGMAMGIDLDGNGPTANDVGDADGGANDRLNHPVLTGVASGGGTTTISGTLGSLASATYRIEFFTDPTATSTGRGAGEHYLGFVEVTTNAIGNASFNASFPTIYPGQYVTATSTLMFDTDGNAATPLDPGQTSEFSPQWLVMIAGGDYNGDGAVDSRDYVVWRDRLGQSVAPFSGADGNGNGVVDAADYVVWKANYGISIPAALSAPDATPSAGQPDPRSVQSLYAPSRRGNLGREVSVRGGTAGNLGDDAGDDRKLLLLAPEESVQQPSSRQVAAGLHRGTGASSIAEEALDELFAEWGLSRDSETFTLSIGGAKR